MKISKVNANQGTSLWNVHKNHTFIKIIEISLYHGSQSDISIALNICIIHLCKMLQQGFQVRRLVILWNKFVYDTSNFVISIWKNILNCIKITEKKDKNSKVGYTFTFI